MLIEFWSAVLAGLFGTGLYRVLLKRIETLEGRVVMLEDQRHEDARKTALLQRVLDVLRERALQLAALVRAGKQVPAQLLQQIESTPDSAGVSELSARNL